MNPDHDFILDAAALFTAIAEAQEQAVRPLIAEADLPDSQIRVLYRVHYNRDMNMGQLAEKLDVGLPTASYHVEHLVEAGLIERVESKMDRRSKVLNLTPKGQAIINGFLQRPLDQMVNWLSLMQPDDLAMLLQGLKALAQVSGSAAESGSKPE